MNPVPWPEISATPHGLSLITQRLGNTRINCSPWLLPEHDKPPVQTLTAAVLSLRVINPAQPTLWLEIHRRCIFCRPAKRAIDAASGHRAKIISRAIGVVCLLMLAMWNVEPSQYTPRHRPFLEKHGSSLQNRCWLLLRDLSLTVPIQKKDEPSSLTKRRKERD